MNIKYVLEQLKNIKIFDRSIRDEFEPSEDIQIF